jgi:hypothetical protein
LDHGGYYGNRIPLIPALNIPYELIDETLAILDRLIGEAEAVLLGSATGAAPTSAASEAALDRAGA